MNGQFKYLFTPINLGKMTVRNRIYLGPCGQFADKNNIMDERFVEFARARAKGGVGLIIAGMMVVMRNSGGFGGFRAIYDEKAIPMLRQLAEAVHNEGATIIVQLCHVGRASDPELTRLPAWAPSAVPGQAVFREVPKEMEIEDIKEVVRAFAKSAGFAKEAGLDGVELHGATGYLLEQFMSPATNKRTDEYGGSLENRLRFPFEVMDAVRKTVGRDSIVGIRIPGSDGIPGGNDLEDMKEIVKKLEATGKIDFIHVGGGFHEGFLGVGTGMHVPLGLWTSYSVGFKQAVHLPVLNDFKVKYPLQAEKILANKQADMVGMVRALIADPELPNKAREGRLDEIRYCISCDQGCFGRAFKGRPITCLQNPTVGLEKEIGTFEPASPKKKILVVGGGPAGMETARVARLRGHEVVLYEKEKKLGGQVNIAVKAPHRREFGEITKYLAKQMKVLGVKVNLGVEVTPELIERENPDAVVIATGSTPFRPPIPGTDQKNVVTVWDVLQERVTIGEKVVVVDGGQDHWPCCSTAEYLVEQGKKVEIITPLLFVGMELATTGNLAAFYKRVRTKGLVFSPNTGLKEISGKTMTVVDVYSNEVRRIKGVDTIVLVTGSRSNNQLYRSLKDKVKELHAVGDCVAPRKAIDAIYDGYNLGRVI